MLINERIAQRSVEPFMKLFASAKSLVLTSAAILTGAVLVSAAGQSEAELVKQATITKSQAEKIALAKAPQGRVQSAEIENEKGHLVWSFDIATPGTRDITEILVDAKSGRIISQQTETARDQAKEAAADKQGK